MIADPPNSGDSTTRNHRRRWRLRVLLSLVALSLVLHGFVHLDRSAVERLGPFAESVHHLFHQEPGEPEPVTWASRRLVKDVAAMGGRADVSVRERGYFGTLGQDDWVNVTFHNPEFDDAALARLAANHGDRITGLNLENTSVTDAGLISLSEFTKLRHLQIRNYYTHPRHGEPVPASKVTDAGMVHLRGLVQLESLNLSDLPITDVGLESIENLPNLMGLYLSRTRVEGRRFGRLKSLPRLGILCVDHSGLTQDGLKGLVGATGLQILSVDGVPLTSDALPLIGSMPRLVRLDVAGCGFLGTEIDQLAKSRPGLRIVRDWATTVPAKAGR